MQTNFQFSLNFAANNFTENNFQAAFGLDFSCSTVLNGEFYIFGGHHGFELESEPSFLKSEFQTSQKSFRKIIGCGLETIGELPFEFIGGSCGTFLFPEERIILCFGDFEIRTKCRRLVSIKVNLET